MDHFIYTKISRICDEIKVKGEIGVTPYLEIGNINIKTKYYSFENKASVKGCRIARKDDVLISRVRPTRGAIVVVKENFLMVSNAFTILRPLQPIRSKYIFYNLAWNQKFLTHLGDNCTGSLYPTVSDNIIIDYSIPFFSFNEQDRIVKKLDLILPRVQNAKSKLEKIPVLLKKFRQSILAAACSGKLTKDWREGKDLPEWVLAKAENITTAITKGTTPSAEDILNTGSIPYLKVYNIVDQKIKFFNKSQYVNHETHQGFLKRSIIYPGDVIMNIVGPPLGKVALVSDEFPEWNINQAIAFFRPIKDKILSKYLYIVLCNGDPITEISMEFRGSAGQQNISLEQARNFLIPLPSLDEQHEIIHIVEKLFVLADSIETKYKKALSRFEKIEQAVLTKAFRGELVESDPNDEPAEELLKRILEEKPKTEGVKKVKKKK